MNDNNPRSRRFNLLLYPDDPTHNFVILQLLSGEFSCAYCLHDKDTYLVDVGEHKAGELKKPHYHAVIDFPNQRYLNSVAKDLGIEKNYLQPTGSFKKSLTYLIHYGDESKYQYDFEEVGGSLKGSLRRFLDEEKLSYAEQSYILLNYIFNSNEYLTFTDITKFALDNNVYNALTRGRGIIENVLFEHNARFQSKKR